MANTKKFYPASFKARVALEALKADQSYEEVANRFSVTSMDVAEWSAALFRNSAAVFTTPTSAPSKLFSGELAQIIAENSTQGLAMTDESGICVYANRAWLEMTGYTAEEISSKPLHDLVHHHYADGKPYPISDCPINRALPEIFNVRTHRDIFFRKDGTMFNVMCAASPVFDAGKPVATIIEIHDITAQNKLEDALREESKALKVLGEISASIVSTFELPELLQLVTDASTKLCGAQFGAFFYNSTDDNGDKFMLYASSGAPKAAFEHFGQPIATALFAATFRGEAAIRLDDVLQDPRYGNFSPHNGMPAGHLPVRSYLAVPVVFRTGEVLGTLLFGHSQPSMFTERHESLLIGVAGQAAIAFDNARLYQKAQHAAEERSQLLESERIARHAAEQQNQAKDTFLAMLGHELRNPLHAISSSIQLIKLIHEPSSPSEKAFNIIDRQSKHLNRMVDNLLDAARMLTGKLSLNKKSCQLDVILKNCIDTLVASGKADGYQIRMALVPAIVMADVTRLDQIFINLLNNSLKYSPVNSTITVSLSIVDNSAIVKIKDEGVGIDQELQQKIFEPFVQGPRTLARSEGGLGMGLTIVKTLVTLHDGTISLSSEGPNKGTLFTIQLPVEINNASEEIVTEYVRPVAKYVVIIEDNEDALEMLSSYLKALDFQVASAKNGQAGIQLIKSKIPDVAIIDIGLPDMDGYEIARVLRTDPAINKIKLITATGYGSNADKAQALEAGFDVHLTKPINMQQLLIHLNS